MRSSEAADPGLHTGLAYLVKNEPYIEHILKYASQKDVSTPIPHSCSTNLGRRSAHVVVSRR
jgi:hypothetical protein